MGGFESTRGGAGLTGSAIAAVARGVRAAAPLFVLAMAAGWGTIAAAGFPAEDPLAVREAVGSGMHAFHAGEFNRAYDDFSQAIEAGTSDPRSHYFRGLAALRLGRTAEAEADFAAGAEREIEAGVSRRVSLSLERVQGHDRLMLERYRSRARLAGIQRDREAYGRRYSAIEDAVGDVRRRRRPEEIPPELVAPGRPPAGEAVEEVPAPAVDEEKANPRKPAAAGNPFEDDDESGDEAPMPETKSDT